MNTVKHLADWYLASLLPRVFNVEQQEKNTCYYSLTMALFHLHDPAAVTNILVTAAYVESNFIFAAFLVLSILINQDV